MKRPSSNIKRNQSSVGANSSYSRSGNLDSSLISYPNHSTQERSLSNHLPKQSTLVQKSYTLPPADSFETFRDSLQKPQERTPELKLKPQKDFFVVNNEAKSRLFVDDYKEFSSKNYGAGYNLDSTVLHNFGIMSGGSVRILPKVENIHKDLRKDVIDVFQDKITLLEAKLTRICEEAQANIVYLVEKHKQEIEETKMKYKSKMHMANRVIEDLQKELESLDSRHTSKRDTYLESKVRDQTQDYHTEVEKAKRCLENEYHDKIQALEDQMKKQKKVTEPLSQDEVIREIKLSFIDERQNLEDAFNNRLKNLEIGYERKIALLQELNKTLKKELKNKGTSTTTPKSHISSSFLLDDSMNSSLKASTEGLCLRCKAFLKADDELSSIQKKLDSFYYE